MNFPGISSSYQGAPTYQWYDIDDIIDDICQPHSSHTIALENLIIFLFELNLNSGLEDDDASLDTSSLSIKDNSKTWDMRYSIIS